MGRYVAFATVLACPVLLIADLGRPERFPKMLRIVKSRSPMSMGSWALAGYGVFAGLGVARQLVEDGLLSRRSPPARVLAWLPLPASGVLGSLFAFFVASYTGVLLSFTNVPVWARNNLLQGPLFLTSALSSGVAATSLVLGLQGDHERARQAWLGRLETAASLGELGLIAAMLASLGPPARPVLRSRHGLSLLIGTVGLGILTPLALRRWPTRSSEERRRRELGADVASLVGALVFRAVALLVGRASARDSREYFAFARDRE